MTDRIRIEFVIPTLDAGGAEKQLTLLASNLDKDRFDVGVTTLTRNGPYRAVLESHGIRVHSINKRFKIDPFAWFRLRRHLAQLKPHVVHTWIFAANAYGRSAAFSSGTPIVLGSERCVDPWKRVYEIWIDRWLAKKSLRDQKIALTTNSTGVTSFYGSKGIKDSCFRVIPNAVELPDQTSVSREEICNQLDVELNDRLVVSVGRLWPQKDYKTAIWAGELIRVVKSNTCYVVIGDGPQRQRLEHFIDQIKAARSIRMAGHRDNVTEILQHCDVFLNTSLYEGQSNSILEAMVHGVPVVATDIPGNRDLVKDEVTGLLVPPGDANAACKAVLRLLNHPDLALQLADNAKQIVETEFTLENLVSRHEQLYTDLCQQSAK